MSTNNYLQWAKFGDNQNILAASLDGVDYRIGQNFVTITRGSNIEMLDATSLYDAMTQCHAKALAYSITSRMSELTWKTTGIEGDLVSDVHYGGIVRYVVFKNGQWFCHRSYSAVEQGKAENEQAALKLCSEHWKACVENFILGLNFDVRKL